MAKAVLTPSTYYPIILGLSHDEAGALATLFRYVGGSSERSRRGFTDAINAALTTVGHSTWNAAYRDCVSVGGVTFADLPTEFDSTIVRLEDF